LTRRSGTPRDCSLPARSTERTDSASPSAHDPHASFGTVPSQPPPTVGCCDVRWHPPLPSGGQVSVCRWQVGRRASGQRRREAPVLNVGEQA